jgi:hypothetical protein
MDRAAKGADARQPYTRDKESRVGHLGNGQTARRIHQRQRRRLLRARWEQPKTEADPPGADFLAELSRDWEAEACKANRSGLRLVLLAPVSSSNDPAAHYRR